MTRKRRPDADSGLAVCSPRCQNSRSVLGSVILIPTSCPSRVDAPGGLVLPRLDPRWAVQLRQGPHRGGTRLPSPPPLPPLTLPRSHGCEFGRGTPRFSIRAPCPTEWCLCYVWTSPFCPRFCPLRQDGSGCTRSSSGEIQARSVHLARARGRWRLAGWSSPICGVRAAGASGRATETSRSSMRPSSGACCRTSAAHWDAKHLRHSARGRQHGSATAAALPAVVGLIPASAPRWQRRDVGRRAVAQQWAL